MGWRIALLFGWIAALVGLVAVSDEHGLVYVVGGALVTVAVGALVNRTWVGAVPALVTILVVGGIFLLIGGCDDECGGDDGFVPIVEWFLLVFTVPATVALLAGVGLRRLSAPGGKRRGQDA
jgi:hypothetical protein